MNKSFCLSCAIPAQQSEIAYALLYSCRCRGINETPRGGDIGIEAFFDDELTAEAARRRLQTAGVAVEAEMREVPPQDWMATWRENMRPADLGNGLWASPPWLPPQDKNLRHWIKIEPKMAFGSGHHETTRCAAALLYDAIKTREPPVSVLDIGTGSGVLCFIASAMGAYCTGLEIDGDCRLNLAENRALNADANTPRFVIGTCDALKMTALFDGIVMNMILNESAHLLNRIRELCRTHGVFIWSGLLAAEKREAIARACASGFGLNRELSEGEWWAGEFIAR